VEAVDGGFCDAELLLHNLRLDAQVRQLVSQPLCFYAQALALLLADAQLLFKQDAPLNGHVVLGLDVFERRRLVAGLALVLVALDLNVAQPELEGPLGVAQGGDFLLQRVLSVIGLGFALLVLGLDACVSSRLRWCFRSRPGPTYLPLLHVKLQPLSLLL